jgi:hypothetical protein
VKPAREGREPAPRGSRLIIAHMFYSVNKQPPDMGFYDGKIEARAQPVAFV